MAKTLAKEPRPGAPGGTLVLGGRERTLRFDLNALATLEDELGVNVLDGTVWQNMNVRTVRAMLWVGLLHEDESLTLHEVGSWIDLANVEIIADQVTTALGAAMPEPDSDATDASAEKK